MNSDLYDFITVTRTNKSINYKNSMNILFNTDKNFMNLETNDSKGKDILLKIWKSILKGLIFIHQKNIIHLDLKCRNVLIKINSYDELNSDDLDKENIQIKITDFDNSQLDYKRMTKDKKNIIPDDIEFKDLVFKPNELNKKEYSEKTDIYLYGLLLLEFSFLMSDSKYDIYKKENKSFIDNIIKNLQDGNRNIELKFIEDGINFNPKFTDLLIKCFKDITFSKDLYKKDFKTFRNELFKPEFKIYVHQESLEEKEKEIKTKPIGKDKTINTENTDFIMPEK